MVQHPNGDDSPALDQRLVKALDHPVRASFLKLLAAQASLSPRQALPLLQHEELALSNVAYHARVLAQVGLVEPTGEPEPLGGASFRPTSMGEIALSALGHRPLEGNGS